ncbi:MAG TPA: hypothetical protein VM030_11470 [Acidimicrobiales bacterium]|nr:hypothetical protein [Acidimicrobiales bacterium]
MKNVRRVIAAGTALGLISVVGSAGVAGAVDPVKGVGTTQASTSVLNATIGDLLSLRVLGDDARSTIDPQVSAPEAFSRLTALSLKSAVLPALNVTVPATPLEARSPGANPNAAVTGVDLTQGIQGIALPGTVATGTLDAALRSVAGADASRASIDAVLKDLKLAAGLLSVSELSSKLGTGATGGVADGARGVKVGAIEVLNLGQLLDGINLPISDLPISTLSNMLKSLGVPVPGVSNNVSLATFAATLNTAIDSVQSTIDTQSQSVTGTVDSTVGSLLNTLDLPVPVAGAPVAQVNATVDSLQKTLSDTLATVISTLSDLSLLKLAGLDISVATKAVDTVKGSAATITARLGDVSVGNIKVPGMDLLAPASQINGLVSTVNGTLGSTLGAISPDLANLVSVSVLDQVKSVTSGNGYTRSRAGITGLTANIVPPAALGAIVDTVKSLTGAGDVITGLGGTVPGLPTGMASLEGTLGAVTGLLAKGASIKVAEIASASDFTASSVGSPAPFTELPRTGGNGLMAALALVLGALGLGIRRFSPVAIRSTK